jgi:nuclear transport factor 2 (NTF2) superfamily protein
MSRSFLQEDLSFLKNDTIKELLSVEDLWNSLDQNIQMVWFNKKHPENLTVFLENENEGFCMENGEWVKREVEKITELLSIGALNIMVTHSKDLEGDNALRFMAFGKAFKKKYSNYFDG